MPGDVITEEFLIEAKTRGSTTTRGEKMITIHRSWLTKTQKDAERTGKKPVLVFKFKGDRTQWFIMNFDDLIEIAQTLREYREYFEQDPGE